MKRNNDVVKCLDLATRICALYQNQSLLLLLHVCLQTQYFFVFRCWLSELIFYWGQYTGLVNMITKIVSNRKLTQSLNQHRQQNHLCLKYCQSWQNTCSIYEEANIYQWLFQLQNQIRHKFTMQTKSLTKTWHFWKYFQQNLTSTI